MFYQKKIIFIRKFVFIIIKFKLSNILIEN